MRPGAPRGRRSRTTARSAPSWPHTVDPWSFPGFQPLKADALLREERANPLVADVLDHPFGHKEISQLGQTPGGKRQLIVCRTGLGDLLDLTPLRHGELRRSATLVLRVQRGELAGVDVADHIPHPVLSGERDLRDRDRVHALG